jgi:hypothetical protein
MGKNIFCLLLCIITSSMLWAQTLTPKAISTSGGSSSVAGGTVSWSIGETNIATLTSGTTVLSQGIQQPEVDILTGSITGTAFCAGVAVSVPFTASGYYGSGNVFTAQLSDGSGNFASPVNIGTLTSTVSGTVSATIPANTASGSGYRIRVTANLPNYTGLDNGADITVRPQFTTGEITTTGETICYNASPAAAIGNATDASGGDLSITYSWRSSADSYATAISGAIASTYTPAGPLTSSTSYRRYAKDNTCHTTPTVATGTWTVTIRPQFTTGAIETTGETICYNDNPAEIGNTTFASGGNASISYQWQKSTTSSSAGFSNIDLATSASYDPPTGLTVSTWYRRQAKDGTCNTTFTTSLGVWKVTVNSPTPILTGDTTVTQGQVVTYSTPNISGNSYTWNASHGNPEICFPYRNCLTLTWDFPCGIINPGYVKVTETNLTTGCSTTVTKWITIVQ